MSHDDDSHPTASGKNNLGKTFDQAQDEIDQQETTWLFSGMTPNAVLNLTAQLEIDLNQEENDALDGHDATWKQLSDRLAYKQFPEPSVGFDDMSSVRDIQEEYTSTRTQWELQQWKIVQQYEAERQEIRSTGHTLSSEFHHSTVEVSQEVSCSYDPSSGSLESPQHGNLLQGEFEQETGACPEFTRQDPDRSPDKER